MSEDKKYIFGGIVRADIQEEEIKDMDVFAVIDQLDQSEGLNYE